MNLFEILIFICKIQLIVCSISSLCVFRSQSKSTNLGKLMEYHGPRLLGPSYKNPLESFELFRRFSVEHPEVSINVECCRAKESLSQLWFGLM